MPLLSVVIVLVAVGIGLWLLNHKVTIITDTIKQIINIVVVVVVVIWLMRVFGLLAAINSVTV